MGPAFGVKNAILKEASKNVFLALDLSGSMKTSDLAPNRFEFAKLKMLELVSALKNTKTGLIVFSSEAYIHAPISADIENVKLYINLISNKQIEDKGTNLLSPILLAKEKFNQLQLSKDESNILVVFSDGGNYDKQLTSITDSINNPNFKIFTCGIGKKNNTYIRVAGLKVNTKLESNLLEEIAQNFQGKYWEFSSYQSDVKSLSKAINEIQSNQSDRKNTDYENNKYFYFLLIALILLILDILISINIITI